VHFVGLRYIIISQRAVHKT